MLHQRAMLDHREEAIKQGISQVIWDAMTKELGETGINKIAEVWNLAVQARKNWHGGQPGLSRENVPELIDKIIAICVDIHPALAWHHEEARKHEERGWKKK